MTYTFTIQSRTRHGQPVTKTWDMSLGTDKEALDLIGKARIDGPIVSIEVRRPDGGLVGERKRDAHE